MFLSGFNIVEMLYRIPGILIGLSVHECAHAYAAYKLGDPTAKNLGRLTLDPLKHVDIIGMIMLVLVGFGWAKPVMVNPRNFKKPRRDDTIVSLAGAAANLLTAFILTGVVFLLQYAFLIDNMIVFNIIYSAILINLSLAIFNIIPIPPLDGYHVLKNALIRIGADFFWQFERYGQYILIIFIISGMASATIGFLLPPVFNLFLSFFKLFV